MASDDAPSFEGLNGTARRALAQDLWGAATDGSAKAVLLAGLSGTGKSTGVVAPILGRWREDGRLAVSMSVPVESSDLEQELLGFLIDELVNGDHGEAAERIAALASLRAALGELLKQGAMVVVDEFQRLVGAGDRPRSPFDSMFLDLAGRPGDGGTLWLVSNRLVDPSWAENFDARVLRSPDDQDAVSIVLDHLPADKADGRFPTSRRVETVRRLGCNPRVLKLLARLLESYELEELIGEPTDVPEMPAEPALVEAVERSLLVKAAEGLSESALSLLRDLSILRNGGTWGVVEAIGEPYGDVHESSIALRYRFLVDVAQGRFSVSPAIRESLAVRLRSDESQWKSANERAGDWFASHLDGSRSLAPDGARASEAIANARFHLTEAGNEQRLADAMRFVGGQVKRRYTWTSPSAGPSELDARIQLVELFVEDADSEGLNYYLAKLLRDRQLPGDLPRAIEHAQRATTGQDIELPWVLWIKLLHKNGDVVAALEASRLAVESLAFEKSTHAVYQLLGACLDQVGKPAEAVEALLQGAARIANTSFRLIEEALWFAAAEIGDELMGQVIAAADPEHYRPQAALASVLSLERNGRWAEAAAAARLSRADDPAYMHLVQHEALAHLGANDPESAVAALAEFPRPLRSDLRTALTWLKSMTSLMAGEPRAAGDYLASYLGRRASHDADVVRATLLKEWDSRVRTVGEPNPSLEFPILPASLTGTKEDVRRPQYSGPLLPADITRHAEDVGAPPRYLAVATEWSSGKGGLSTLNRQLCIALASVGADVTCVIPEVGADEEADAAAVRVKLIEPPKAPGLDQSGRLGRRPLTFAGAPQVVIGHGRITGPPAQTLAEDIYPSSHRLHFIHMAPDEIEWLKSTAADPAEAAEQRTQVEVDLAITAYRSFAVGPRLFNRFRTDVHAAGGSDLLRIDPGFDSVGINPAPPPGSPLRVLIVGRTDDVELKGLRFAARILGQVVAGGQVDQDLELRVRGAVPGTAEQLRDVLVEAAGTDALEVVIRNFTVDNVRLQEDLLSASLVLMPSRVEGFGLAGLESIVRGVPTLVSRSSGLGELLIEILGEAEATMVLSVVGNAAADLWATAITHALQDRPAAFARAVDVRAALSTACTWAFAASAVRTHAEGE